MTVFSPGTLLISAIFVEVEVDAMRIIGYGVTLRDGMPGCSFKLASGKLLQTDGKFISKGM
ncbi:protein RALF-like 9 [Pyrus ussuriensis x Pyrus communis]|uniref:Protein RALF-like 9 n=1 Tax=Pyrus ussuriensis x Pyrus communis TaxID=2448454 RepID=A0A5N5GEH4_9ROSA|nr:protein RALF-like 9 [Pyrus ussuriensis x Pyrus communis]